MHEGKATRQALITELREADKSLQDPEEAAADAFETRATMVKLAGTDHAAGATAAARRQQSGAQAKGPPAPAAGRERVRIIKIVLNLISVVL